MVTVLMGTADPRSTCHHLVAPSEHHLSEFPPLKLPLTALSAVSLPLQLESAVAGLCSARFVPGPGPGPGDPVSNDGGASAAAVPQEVLAVVPSVSSSVPPEPTNDS